MDTEKNIDNFIKRARDHLQKKVNVAVRKTIEGRAPGAEFWMGNKAAYKEMDDWFDALFDDSSINSEINYPKSKRIITGNSKRTEQRRKIMTYSGFENNLKEYMQKQCAKAEKKMEDAEIDDPVRLYWVGSFAMANEISGWLEAYFKQN